MITGSFTADLPYPGMLTWPRSPAVMIVHTHARPIPCCQSHGRGKIKWCNAIGYKPVVTHPHYAAACEGCKADQFHKDHPNV